MPIIMNTKAIIVKMAVEFNPADRAMEKCVDSITRV